MSPEKVLFKSDVADAPVDVVRVASRFGVEVIRVSDAPWLSALDYDQRKIYVTDSVSWQEQRMLIAHQLGHAFLHYEAQNTFKLFNMEACTTDELEIEAAEFASELLVPTPWLRAFAYYESIDLLAQRFDVTVKVITDHLIKNNITAKRL